MPGQVVKAVAADKQDKKPVLNGDKTPQRKPSKNERGSQLCATPPTCIKDKDCNVEYTRKELLGEVKYPINE
jgi:hypothetical protein